MCNSDRNPSRVTRVAAAAAAALSLMAVGASAQAQTYLSGDKKGGNDYHVVNDGDTLWDLSGSYYGDTYEWPRMWSYNAHITNPHWIYPGDIVYLRGATGAQPQSGQAQSSASQALGAAPAGGLYLPVGGYILNDEAPYVGRIRGAGKGASMLSEFDTAWVGFGDDAYSEDEQKDLSDEERAKLQQGNSVQVGDRFSIVREAGSIKDDDGDAIGYKYLVVGVAQLTKTSEEHFDEIDIVQSWQEIYRGDMLIPYERQLKVVKQTAATTDGVAKVVDTLRPGSIFGEQNYVFINRGAQDGVRSGNRFFAYQRFEGLHIDEVDSALDEKIPWSRVGQMMVIDVRENFSTALIIDSSREIAVGDRLEMYDGH